MGHWCSPAWSSFEACSWGQTMLPKSYCLGHTSLLESSGTASVKTLQHFSLCSCVTVWWFRPCITLTVFIALIEPSTQTINRHPQALWPLFYWTRRKQKKLKSPLASMGKCTKESGLCRKICPGPWGRSGQHWFKAAVYEKQGDDGSIAWHTAGSKGTDIRLEQALLCVSNNHRVTGGFSY